MNIWRRPLTIQKKIKTPQSFLRPAEFFVQLKAFIFFLSGLTPPKILCRRHKRVSVIINCRKVSKNIIALSIISGYNEAVLMALTARVRLDGNGRR